MNFRHDLAEISRQELNQAGIRVPKEWDDYKVCMEYLEISRRWFDSSVSYKVEYSIELQNKLENLKDDEQRAIQDIEERLRFCETIVPYMSKKIRCTSVEKSDFLLKNWNIYHLHLEKDSTEHTNRNLLFFIPKDDIVHFIDVKPHPKGNSWYNEELFNVIYDNWPHLLNYKPGDKPTISKPGLEIHELLKKTVAFVPFRNGLLFPTTLGITTSGNSILSVIRTDNIFNSFSFWQEELGQKEDEIKKEIYDNNQNLTLPEALDYQLIIENGYFVAYEVNTKIKIKMFPVS